MSLKINNDNLKEGLLGLAMAVVEILKETLQRQAIHRLESGSLSDEEAERLGNAFMKLDETIAKIKKENNIERTSDQIMRELDELVDKTVGQLINPACSGQTTK